MNRSIILIACLSFIVGGLSETLSQEMQLIAANDKVIISNGGRTSSSFLNDETFLETIFSPDTVPHLNIAVLEHALGDVLQDSVINILDLLRLRDIIIGRPPSPSPYELMEGDITREGTINSQDLYILRDILLFKIGVPYVIDSTGGQVLGDGIILTIPPGAIDSPIVISIRRTSESEFGREMGVDTKGAVEDSAYFMASFEILSDKIDFKLPAGAEIKLDSIPPCAYQGLNGLFAAVPDQDGDGHSELFLINELEVLDDSLKLTAKDLPIPSINSLSSSQLEPGQILTISGNGFSDNVQTIRVQFISMSFDSINVIPQSVMTDSMLLITIPNLPEGQYQLRVQNIMNGLISNSYPIEILPYSPVTGDIRSIILDFYVNSAESMDSISADSLYGSIEDTTVRNDCYQKRQMTRADLDSMIAIFTSMDDSTINDFADIASFIQNLVVVRVVKNHYKQQIYESEDCSACDVYDDEFDKIEDNISESVAMYNKFAAKCARSQEFGCSIDIDWKDKGSCFLAEGFRKKVLFLTDIMARLANLQEDCQCRNCGGTNCDKCPKTTYIGFGPQAAKVFGGYDNFKWYTRNCCLNIIRYQRNECIGALEFVDNKAPVPLGTRPELKCPEWPEKNQQTISAFSIDLGPHPGSIIKVTNAPVPYNIRGILNNNGKAFIPHVPKSTKVTFSIYDPVSGLYDTDAGTYTTGPTAGGFDRPMLLFRPNTTIRNFSINIGDMVHDSVAQDMQRIDYSLIIGAADTSKLLNIGFSSTARLSLHIEDPDGIVLFDNMDISCYMNSHVRLNKIGHYYIRVALGVSTQPGQFDLGVTESPSKPLPSSCICGDIVVDTLYEELSPYEVLCSATVVSNDTLVSEAGVVLEFDEGGVITVNGIIRGTGSPMKPISLKHYIQADKGKSLSIGDKIKNGTQRRKEVEP